MILIYSCMTVQTDDQMSDRERLCNCQDDAPSDGLAGKIRLPGVIRLDVELGDITVSICERGSDT